MTRCGGVKYDVILRTMDIHITRKGEKHGPYPEATARQFLEEGKLLPTDMAWHAGADGWKPLSEVLGATSQPPAAAPPPKPPGGGIPKRTLAGAAPAEAKPAEEKTEGSEGDDPDKIRVARKGEPIGPYSRDKAKEYFATGQLLPTDWGWHDGMDEWKPLYEVLGMEVPTQTTVAAGKPGKGKKVAMIAGIVVLVSGLVFAGITYGPGLIAKISGGGKIETSEELVNLAMEAFKANDKDAFMKLTPHQFSKGQLKDLMDETLASSDDKLLSGMAKLKGVSVDELKDEMRGKMESKWNDEEKRKEDLKRNESRFDEFRTAAEDAGVDWSDVTVSKVDTSKKSTGGPFGVSKSAESTFKSVRDIVTITSKGKDYEVTLNCRYASSVGWFLDGPPRWPRTRPRR